MSRARRGCALAWLCAVAPLAAQQPRPAGRFLAAGAAPFARGRIVMFGGASDSGTFFNDTWEWTGTAWFRRVSPPGAMRPAARAWAAAAFDAARGRLLVFGGSTFSDSYRDTWLWDGSRWIRADSATGPEERASAAIANDTARHRLVLFGGGNTNDTWEWDGGHWIAIVPAGPPPPARRRHALAYDAARRRILLFAGVAADGRLLDDTWTWDGVQWTALAPGTSPPRRSGAAAAYDPGRGRVVLFGGADEGDRKWGDTWEWDGAAWSQRATKPAPPPRELALLAYDAAGKRMVLFGGLDTLGHALDDTWGWDGQRWSLLVPGTRTDTAALHLARAFYWTRRDAARLVAAQERYLGDEGRYARSLADLELDTARYSVMALTEVTDSSWAGSVARGPARCAVGVRKDAPPRIACIRRPGRVLTATEARDSARAQLGRALMIREGAPDDRPRKRDLLFQAVTLFRLAGDADEARPLAELATLDDQAGRRDSALARLRLALKLAGRRGGMRSGIATVPEAAILVQMGEIYRHDAAFDSALACWRRALAPYQQQHSSLEGSVLMSIGAAELDAGRADSAVAAFRGAQVAALRAGDTRSQRDALLGWARALDRLGRSDEAARYRAQAANLPP